MATKISHHSRIHGQCPQQKVGMAEAGAEGGSFVLLLCILDFHLSYPIYFIIFLLVVATEVLVGVNCGRQGHAPVLDPRDTQTGWQRL